MTMVSRRLMAFIFVCIIVSAGWQVGRSISQLPEITANQITNDATVFFGVDNTAAGRSYKLSLAELKNTQSGVRNVKQFGAVGNWDIETGVGNEDTQAFIDAIAATPEGGVLYIPEGNYRISGVNITKPIRIEGPGVLVVGVNEKGFDIDLASYWSNAIEVTANSSYQLTGSSSPTATKLTTATAHGCKQGDVLKILTEYIYNSSVVPTNDAYRAEIIKVVKVIDDDEFVVDRNQQELFNFSLTDAWVRKLPTGRVEIDVNFDIVPGGEATERTIENEALVCIQGAVDPNVKVNAVNAYGPIVRLQSCFKGSVEVYAGDVDGPGTVMSSPFTDTGVDGNSEFSPAVLLVACNGTHVSAVTSGGKSAVYLQVPQKLATFNTDVSAFSISGHNENVTIHDSVAYAPYECGFYIGADSVRTTVSNCQVFYSTLLDTSHSQWWPAGYYSAGIQTRFDGCRVNGARYGWILAGDFINTGYFKTLNGCEDTDVTEASIYDVGSTYRGMTTDIRNHRSTSTVTFLKHFGQGGVYVSDTNIYRHTVSTVPTFSLEIQGAALYLDDVTEHRRADADHPVVLNVKADCLYCAADVRNFRLITQQTGRSDSFVNIEANSSLRLITENVTYQQYQYSDGEPAVDWFSEGFVDASTSSQPDWVSNQVGPMGRRFVYDGTIPAAGTWKAGDIVINTDPDASEFYGWICVEGGSPGTWKGFAAIDN